MTRSRSLIVEFAADGIRGLLYSSSFGKVRVEKTESVRSQGEPSPSDVEKLLELFPADAVVTLMLPGRYFMISRISLPFTDLKKIRKALPYELEGLLPLSPEELYADSLASTPAAKGAELLALSIPRKVVSEYMELFPEGRKPSRVIPDLLSLLSLGRRMNEKGDFGVAEMKEGSGGMVLISGGRPELMRSFFSGEGGVAVGEEMAATIRFSGEGGKKMERVYAAGGNSAALISHLKGIAETVPLPPSVGDIYLEDKSSWAVLIGGAFSSVDYPWFNMLGAGAESERLERLFRTVAVGVFILLLLVTIDLFQRYRADMDGYLAVKEETRKVFTTAVPQVKNIVKEEAQLRDAINREKGTRDSLLGKPSPLYSAPYRELEKITAENSSIKVKELVFEADTLVVSGETVGGLRGEELKKIFSVVSPGGNVNLEELSQGAEPDLHRFRVRIGLKGN